MLTLVLGGAASGKSEYAESLVLKTTGPRYYLATMQVWDAECAARVEKHRKMRAAKQFETVECPLHLDNVRLPARGTALLEDLGNLAANELYDPAGAGENAAKAILHGLESLAAQCENLIVVSNEVFSGGADYAGDTGRYLLALAQVNNAFAARADAVVRVVCGIPVHPLTGNWNGSSGCTCVPKQISSTRSAVCAVKALWIITLWLLLNGCRPFSDSLKRRTGSMYRALWKRSSMCAARMPELCPARR